MYTYNSGPSVRYTGGVTHWQEVTEYIPGILGKLIIGEGNRVYTWYPGEINNWGKVTWYIPGILGELIIGGK